MRNSTRQLSQISLLFILILKTSLVLSTRPEATVNLTPRAEDLSSEQRFLQKNNNNQNTGTCPSGRWCTLTATTNVQYTIVMNSGSYLTSMIWLANQPETALTIAYTSTSSSANITTELYLGYGQTTKTIDTPLTNSFSAVVPEDSIQAYNGGAVYFSVDNESSGQTTITIKMTFASSSSSSSGSSLSGSSSSSSLSTTTSDDGVSLVYIILPIAGTLLLIFFFGICCHYRRKRQQEQERMARVMRGGRRARGARGGEDQQADEEEVEDEDPLTEQNITERFPEAKFDNLKSSFPQNTCSVCLEEFQKGVACRQLYCEHMFHSECIRLWLSNQLKKGHAFCPNCNKNMMSKPQEAPSVDIQA